MLLTTDSVRYQSASGRSSDKSNQVSSFMKLKFKGAEISKFELDLRLLLPLRCNLILRVSPDSDLSL